MLYDQFPVIGGNLLLDDVRPTSEHVSKFKIQCFVNQLIMFICIIILSNSDAFGNILY